MGSKITGFVGFHANHDGQLYFHTCVAVLGACSVTQAQLVCYALSLSQLSVKL